jgi:hypothetical protein
VVSNETPKTTKFTHIGVREATKERIDASKLAYEKKIRHQVSMAEYMDLCSKQPFTTDYNT